MFSPNDVLQFWFHNVTDDTIIHKNKPPFSYWFAHNNRFDTEIRRRFEGDLRKAKAGECKDWEDSPRGRLALVILFDQFSRNMFRNAPQAFETDRLALDLTLWALEDGTEQHLNLIERVFLYMPLMHAEDLDRQERSVLAFECLIEESKIKSPHNTSYFEYNRSFARWHRATIAQFGRFPQRNAVLGRVSTNEELAFLAKPAPASKSDNNL